MDNIQWTKEWNERTKEWTTRVDSAVEWMDGRLVEPTVVLLAVVCGINLSNNFNTCITYIIVILNAKRTKL